MGAVASNLYMGLINEPSDSSPGPTAPHSPGSLDVHGLPPGAGWKELEAQGAVGAHLIPAATRLPAWTWAGVESLFQAKVWSRLSPAPCKPSQDVQPLVLMAGKVAVCLLDSHHREGGKNNRLLLFPCSSSKRLKRIFMCCCCPHILWPDPALSCAAVRHTRVMPRPSSASRGEARPFSQGRVQVVLWKRQNPPGSLSLHPPLPPASHHGSALQLPPGTSVTCFSQQFLSPQGSSHPCAQARQEKKANEVLPPRTEQAPQWLRGESPGCAAALAGAGFQEVLPLWPCWVVAAQPSNCSAGLC